MAITFTNLFLVATCGDGTARIDFMCNEIAGSDGKKLRDTENVGTVYMTRSDLAELGKAISQTLENKPIAKH